jgi:2,4-dienoyl-CoA reductase (NADPH2)
VGLFSPLGLGGFEVENRLVMPPMGTGLPDADGKINDETVAYYRRRAHGGVGMVCVEASLVMESAHGVGPEIRLHDDRFAPGLERLAAAVHEARIPVGIQLWHPGRQTSLGRPVGPSAIALTSRSPVPHALTEAEIDEIIASYAEAALRCRDAGFDFVEVHAAHGYLPSEFLSPIANAREDRFGGDLRDRATFLLAVIHAIRSATGAEYPVFVRLSGSEGVEGGGTIDDAAWVARWLEEAGVVCISVSAGSWRSLHLTIPPMSMEPGCLVPYAAAIKAGVDIPVMASGRLDCPELAERALLEGAADLIGVGRALIADPDWPKKVRGGDLDSIRPCIACNACAELVANADAARCAVNPAVGREHGWSVVPAAVTRRVMVVGAGPAGLEAALTAARRGHNVTLWDRNPELGGKLDVASRAPNKSVLLRFRDFEARELQRLAVSVRLGVEVTQATVAEENPDVIVVATGASAVTPGIAGVERSSVIDAQDILLGHTTVAPGERVAVVGGSATGCETAEILMGTAGEVTVFEMLGRVGRGVEQITRRRLLDNLRAGGVVLRPNSEVVAITEHGVRYRTNGGPETMLRADHVALAVGWRPRGGLLATALGEREIYVVGDAAYAADFVAAVGAGADAGLAI